MQCEVRIKLKDDDGNAFVGIGSIWLLENIQSFGSVRAAAAAMELSYPKALKLIKSLEDNLGYEVVKRTKGGSNHGGAELTAEGLLFLENFRKLHNELQQEADRRASTFWQLVKKTGTILSFLLLGLLPFIGCACKGGERPAVDSRLSAADYTFVTDAAGRRVRIPKNIRKVAPAGPPAAIMLYVAVPDLLAGWSMPLAEETLANFPETARTLPVLGRLSGRGGTANYEQFIRNGIDLIVDVGDVGGTYVSLADRVQEQTGIPYLLLDGSLENSAASLELLARALGREQQIAPLADEVGDLLARAAASREYYNTVTPPKIYLAKGNDGLETAGQRAIHGQLLPLLGLENVVSVADAHGLSRISLEQLYALQPDYILTNDSHLFKNMINNQSLNGLKAVREGRFLALPEYPLGWLSDPPSINRLLGIPWLLVLTGQLDLPMAEKIVTSLHNSMFHCPVPQEALELLRKAKSDVKSKD